MPRRLARGERQVVQEDCRAASADPAFHAMLERYGGMRAQVVTGIRDDAGELVAILSVHELRAPRMIDPARALAHRLGGARARGGDRVSVHELRLPIRRPLIDAPDTGHNRWHPDVPPALVVEPGDEVVVDCRDGLDGLVTPTTRDEDLHTLELRRAHPMSGPIAVRGASPGDALRVEILEIAPDDFGSTAIIPGFGLLAAEFPDPYLVTWGLRDGAATSGRLPDVRVPADPFLGVLGVAPSAERLAAFTAREAALAARGGVALPPVPGCAVPATEPYASTALRTIPPRETGGNIDVRDARAGSVVFFPVDVEGALLSLGDAHFAQGDGEVCGTAIEMHARVRLRLDVVPRDRARWLPSTPAFESSEPLAPPTGATSSPPACPSTPTARTTTWICCWRPATRCAR